jgi:hypothetical protein
MSQAFRDHAQVLVKYDTMCQLKTVVGRYTAATLKLLIVSSWNIIKALSLATPALIRSTPHNVPRDREKGSTVVDQVTGLHPRIR